MAIMKNLISRLIASKKLSNRPLQRIRNMSSESKADSNQYPHGMHFHTSPIHKNIGLGLGTVLWLWIFYRAKEDGAVMLGLRHPWEHGDHHEHGEKEHNE